jgi:hypothetical protein
MVDMIISILLFLQSNFSLKICFIALSIYVKVQNCSATQFQQKLSYILNYEDRPCKVQISKMRSQMNKEKERSKF